MENSAWKVLLIENDELDAKLVKYKLGEDVEHEFLLETAGTLESACGRIAQGDIDVILADLSLPDSDNRESALKILSDKAHDIPIVILTGYNDTFELDSVRSGAQDYVVKDQATRHLLVQTILRAIERQHLKQENRVLIDQLERIVLLDPLTELLNRRGLQKILSREIAWVRRNGSTLLVILLDLDDFKQVNDQFGYAVGDEVLKHIAEKLSKTLRTTDYISRVGGDEFVILLPQTHFADGMKVAEKIRLTVSERPVEMGSNKIKLTASLGLIKADEEINTVEVLLTKAHYALARSKQQGKNCVSSAFSAGHVGGAQSELLDKVVETLKNGKAYHVVKQPLLRLDDLQIVGYEFLSRSSVEVFKNPIDFFRLGLEYNILSLIDYHCFKNCINAAGQLPPGLKRHINLYPSTLTEIGAEHLLKEFLKESTLPDFCIEISEELIVGDPANFVKAISEFRKAGLRIAIDDIGFGRSSLEILVVLEPDVAKIDKKLVIGIAKDKGRIRALGRLLKVVHTLEAEAIAEGIETEEDLNVLKSLGVGYGQGFLFGKPE